MQIQYSNFSSSISYDTSKNKTGEKNTLGLNSQNSTEEKDETKQNSTTQEKKDNPNELTQDEQRVVSQLQITDTKVRVHEMAHVAAGGTLTGGASYTYARGPDNKMYAIAGEVPISMSEGNTPEKTIANARQIQAAALAPSDPSPQDYTVAANAMKMEINARTELNKQKAEEKKAEQELKEKKQADLSTNSQENKANVSNQTTSFNQNENTLATNYHSNNELDLKQKSSLDNDSETNLNQRANLVALAYQEQNKAQDQSSFSFIA